MMLKMLFKSQRINSIPFVFAAIKVSLKKFFSKIES